MSGAEQSPGSHPPRAEVYTHGHSEVVVDTHARRTAEREAAFFLPYLRPGMRVLDVGCGPGSITVGLAQAVKPGSVVGVDREASILDLGRTLAAQNGQANVEFREGDLYALPFPDGSFDAAFAHAVLEHLARPADALRELRRVVRVGGVVGLRDVDWGSTARWPADAAINAAMALYARVWRSNGGDPDRGRQLRGLLLEAGWTPVATSASFNWDGSPEATREFARFLARRLRLPRIAGRLQALGWAEPVEIERLSAGCEAWGARPDAFAATMMGEAVGRLA